MGDMLFSVKARLIGKDTNHCILKAGIRCKRQNSSYPGTKLQSVTQIRARMERDLHQLDRLARAARIRDAAR